MSTTDRTLTPSFHHVTRHSDQCVLFLEVVVMAKADGERKIHSTTHQAIKPQNTKREPPAPYPLNTVAVVQRAMSDAVLPSASEMLHLQRIMGNRAVGQLIARRQPS